jgi:hypothetical protein
MIPYLFNIYLSLSLFVVKSFSLINKNFIKGYVNIFSSAKGFRGQIELEKTDVGISI